MRDAMTDRLRRLQNQIDVLKSRNESLRAELERARLGVQAPWTDFVEAADAVLGDGSAVKLDPSKPMPVPGDAKELEGKLAAPVIFVNSRYQVSQFPPQAIGRENGKPVLLFHLSIKRVDGAAIHDWRDLQRIKNEILGEEAEGVELYPAESRLVDGANQYHLWVLVGSRFPFGFSDRLVAEPGGMEGVQQRPHE